MYVNWSAELVAEVPPGVVTITWTMLQNSQLNPPPAGLIAVICVSLTTVKCMAAVAPKKTPVAQVKPLPVIVTLVPPLAGPLVGLMIVTVGGGRVSKELSTTLTP